MNKRLRATLLSGLALSLALAGAWGPSHAQQGEGRKRGKVRVFEEEGPAGHKSIGVDESSLGEDPGKETPVTFASLMEWEYDAGENSQPPERVKRLDGRKVRIVGFMYPLQGGEKIKTFAIIRSTQTCCYGPRPQYNQYILVEMVKPVQFRRFDPVSCVGVFRVDPSPDEGFIYRMEGESCRAVAF